MVAATHHAPARRFSAPFRAYHDAWSARRFSAIRLAPAVEVQPADLVHARGDGLAADIGAGHVPAEIGLSSITERR